MSASSGITVSPELSATFSDALTSQSLRFLKVSIKDGVYPSSPSIYPRY